MNEITLQRLLIKKMERIGGYGRKWASAFAVGLPDLILIRNGKSLYVEMKYIRSMSKTFKRKVDLTPKQTLELNRIRGAGAQTLVAVVVDYMDEKYIMMLSPPAPQEALHVSHDMINPNGVSCALWKNADQLLEFLTKED